MNKIAGEPRDGSCLPLEPAALWERFRDEMRGFLSRWAAPADVDDLLQATYLRIHGVLARPIDIGHPRGWIYQVARSALVDHARAVKASNARKVHLSSSDIDLPAAGDDAVEEELAGCLRTLLDALPQPYREALLWTEIDGVTQHEAASRAGISLSGMKSRVQRGRDRLRGALLECCEVELDRRRRPIEYRPKAGCECAGKSKSSYPAARDHDDGDDGGNDGCRAPATKGLPTRAPPPIMARPRRRRLSPARRSVADPDLPPPSSA